MVLCSDVERSVPIFGCYCREKNHVDFEVWIGLVAHGGYRK